MTKSLSQDPVQMKRKFGWRSVVLVLLGLVSLGGCLLAVAGAISMANHDVPTDDIWAALVIAGLIGAIAILLVCLAFQRRNYVDEDGNVVLYIVMAQLIANDSFDDVFDDDPGID